MTYRFFNHFAIVELSIHFIVDNCKLVQEHEDLQSCRHDSRGSVLFTRTHL